ncbi:MAG: hydroxyacid dehydrogenase [Actinomycetes bacterium]|jgi:D-3-phosphoglycerate dehydrogenase
MKVVAADGVAVASLTALAEDDRFEIVPAKGEDVLRAVADADGLIVRSATRVNAALFDFAPSLKVVIRAGVGVDNIDVEEATRRGVAVFNTPAANTIAAAELTFALILAAMRMVPAADRSMREGAWDRAAFQGVECHGKVLGLVGAGRIGREVAARARAFGMTVIAYDPYLTEADGLELCPLDRVIAEADVISLHVPLDDETRGLIDAAAIARMKPGSYLVNASRGGVVDEAALVDALRSGHLAGAGLDVYEEEPLPADSPLRRAPNLVLTPHLGASTVEAQERVATEAAVLMRKALAEGDLSGAVNAGRL